MIKLFDIKNNVIVPSEHCYAIKSLKKIMEDYPISYTKVYAYLFYMCCPDPKENPFFNCLESEKEEMILHELNAEFSTEDDRIIEAMVTVKKLYETPTSRAYNGIKGMLDRLAKYMEDTTITDGKDGNITALVNAAAKFQQIRESYKGAYKDLQDELNIDTRGGQDLAYDQK